VAGARARKIDLSGYLSGQSNVARLISQAGAAEASGTAGLLGGIGAGIGRAGQNLREDRRLKEERSIRQEEKTYQRGQDAFRNSLSLKADARAESDQRIQEDESRRKVAADAAAVEETAMWLTRAKVAMQTGMPMDPKVMEGIQSRAKVIEASGGPEAIMARAAGQVETDPDRLISETARLNSLSKILLQQMGREKNAVTHAALGDSVQQLAAVIASNKKRIEIHDANTKRKQETAEAEAKTTAVVQAERDILAGLSESPVDPMTPAQFAFADDLLRNSGGRMTAEQARAEALGKKPDPTPQQEAVAQVDKEEVVEAERTRRGLKPPERSAEDVEVEKGAARGAGELAKAEVTGEETPEQKRARGQQQARDKAAAAFELWEEEYRIENDAPPPDSLAAAKLRFLKAQAGVLGE
jgi:hypothetical protein